VVLPTLSGPAHASRKALLTSSAKVFFSVCRQQRQDWPTVRRELTLHIDHGAHVDYQKYAVPGLCSIRNTSSTSVQLAHLDDQVND
jgi:hypothetical protein